MRAFKRDVTDSSFNMEAVSMNNVTFLYGGVPSLTRQLSALFPFLLTYLFFFSPLFSLFIFALFNSVCESWKDKFHMPWYRRKYFHNWICSHWLVDVKKKKKNTVWVSVKLPLRVKGKELKERFVLKGRKICQWSTYCCAENVGEMWCCSPPLPWLHS